MRTVVDAAIARVAVIGNQPKADLAGGAHQSRAGGINDAGDMVGTVDDRAALLFVS